MVRPHIHVERNGHRLIGAMLAAIVGFSGCGTDRTSGPPLTEKGLEETVRRSFQAENAKDTNDFLAIWTDKGLKAYDVGTRKELESDKSESFGSEKVSIVKFADVKTSQGKGSATVDVLSGEHKIAKPVFRARFDAIQREDKWILDGFEFLGSPPPPAGAPVTTIDAQDYAFVLGNSQVPANVAFKFSNKGKEPHEISLFKGPNGTDLATAKTALENVNGQELDNVPEGYQVDHIAFSPPGDSVDLTFAEPLSSGDYFLVCYLPQGGFNEQEEPVNPEGAPHVKLGMISKLTVT